jgi:hypothetical protein
MKYNKTTKESEMKTIEEYKNYDGTDASIETSLFEYSLIWAKGIEGHENDYHFIYGVGTDESGNYNGFDWSDVPIDCDPLKEWSWIDLQAILSFVGMEQEEWLKMPIPFIVYDLIAYYGHEEILGSSYYPFEIKE